jgi:hypothetical protein
MIDSKDGGFVAECFWPDVDDADLATLDRRIERALADLTTEPAVRYLGSILLREDEVVLCQFEGRAESVRDVAERAEIPFERILATAHSPWSLALDAARK